MNKQTHLKCISNGRVFLFSESLKQRDDMVACDAEGNIASGHIGDANALISTQERRKTKFLGNMANGVLYPYTDHLANRDDMISIESEEQWKAMKKTGEAPEQAADTVAPSLSLKRETAPEVPVVPIVEANTAGAQGSGLMSLPVIEGLGAREAKTALSEWAEKTFKQKIDRRPALDDVIKACQALIDANSVAKAS